MSVRLTEYHRANIKERAVNASFKKEDDALAKREAKLCRAAYNTLFLPATRKAAAAAPKGWVQDAMYFDFNAGGERIQLKSDAALLVPASHCFHKVYPLKDADIIKEVCAFAREREELHTRKKTAARTLATMLMSINTINQLSEIWPEGKEFYKEYAVPPPPLPAIRTDEVNKLLNLKAA